jgi:hypothetical protein
VCLGRMKRAQVGSRCLVTCVPLGDTESVWLEQWWQVLGGNVEVLVESGTGRDRYGQA